MPPEYDPGELAVPNIRCYRQENPALPGERLPDWVTELDEAPVFAAFGTMHPQGAAWRPVTEAVIAGLSVLGRPAVVAVGTDPARFGPVSSRVRLVEHIPQPLMLQTAALFVHHGGFNSVRESVRCGVPMVIIPWFTDSVANSARCAETGLAAVLPKDVVTPETVRNACAAVLADPAYRTSTARMQRRMLALPPLAQLLTDIEELVRQSAMAAPNHLSTWSGTFAEPKHC
jgi:N-glycosyltransferase